MKKLHRDPYTGFWKYGANIVSEEDKPALEVDLIGAQGEIERWQAIAQNIEEALAQIENASIPPDTPN